MFPFGSEIVFRPEHLRPKLFASESSRDSATAAVITMAMFGQDTCVAQVSCADWKMGTYHLENWPGMELPEHKAIALSDFRQEHPQQSLFRRDF